MNTHCSQIVNYKIRKTMNVNKMIIAIIALLCYNNIVTAQSLDYIKSQIDHGSYLEAAKQLRPLADGGNAEAQVLAAKLFFEGKGVQKNEQQGFKYATMAANKGNEDAVVLMADYYSSKGNDTKAYQTLDKYVAQLNAWKGPLGVEYAKYLIQGKGTEKNPVRGYQLMELGGNTDSPGWKYLFANAKDYLETLAQANGKKVPEYVVWANNEGIVSRLAAVEMVRNYKWDSNKILLFQDYLNFANNNNAWAMYIVARLFEEGLGTQEDPLSAKSWYYKAQNAGNILAPAEYQRMDKRYYVGEKFKGGETIFWVSADGKTASVMSAECRQVDCASGRSWANQTNGWWLPRIDDLKNIVKMRKKMGLKAAGCYWSGNLLCQFDENCNLIKTYDINGIPASLGRVHNCYIMVKIGKK